MGFSKRAPGGSCSGVKAGCHINAQRKTPTVSGGGFWDKAAGGDLLRAAICDRHRAQRKTPTVAGEGVSG